MIKVGVVGGTGYTGVELLRLLAAHPELDRERIRTARLVANPGCYATAVELALLPVVETDFVDHAHLIADAKSGVSGAGRKPEVDLLFAEAADNFKAYAVSGHRHHPEILESLSALET